MPNIGIWEWAFIALIVLVIFGPKSLPKIGQALGKGIREFKDATRGITGDLEDDAPKPYASPKQYAAPAAQAEPVSSAHIVENTAPSPQTSNSPGTRDSDSGF